MMYTQAALKVAALPRRLCVTTHIAPYALQLSIYLMYKRD
jgi:hypothetical protein